MKIGIKAISLLFVIFLIIVGSKIMKMNNLEEGLGYKEDPIYPVTPIGLKGGEIYIYNITTYNLSTLNGFRIIDMGECIKIKSLNIENMSSCVNKTTGKDDGNLWISLKSKGLFLFKPWMLAVKEGWEWKSRIEYNYTNLGTGTLDEYTLKYAGKTSWRGRDAYVVEIKNKKGKVVFIDIVDKEKRILLEETSADGQIKIKLVSAPFLSQNR